MWMQLTRWSKSCMLQVWGGPQVVRQKSKLLPFYLPPSLLLPAQWKRTKLLARNPKKCIQICKFQSNCQDKTDRRHGHRCTTATRWIAPIEDSKTSRATTKFAETVSPLHQSASSQKKIDRRKLGFQLVLESVKNFTPLIPLCRDHL